MFKAVCESKLYGKKLVVEKEECIQHVQKRIGTCLRNLVKPIGGRGRLIAKMIDKLSTSYGKAIGPGAT